MMKGATMRPNKIRLNDLNVPEVCHFALPPILPQSFDLIKPFYLTKLPLSIHQNYLR